VNYLRKVDFAQLAAAQDRQVQRLLDHDSGATTCSVNCIKTPPGEGSPAGMHTHEVDQLFYILGGTMSLEIAGESHAAGPGTLVVFPAGVPHRNWNAGDEATIHLAFNAPLPELGVPFARPAK
jgi:mannose-6-phosphate isomerase-like protein (cupin superfamily)